MRTLANEVERGSKDLVMCLPQLQAGQVNLTSCAQLQLDSVDEAVGLRRISTPRLAQPASWHLYLTHGLWDILCLQVFP